MAVGLKLETVSLKTGHELEVAASAPLIEALCRTACSMFSVPWALIHLNREAGDHGPFGNGLDAWQTVIVPSFRRLLPLSKDTFIVEDASRDPRFAFNAPDTDVSRIGFYAGVPLFIAPGVLAGTICVMDRSARTFTGEQRRQLEDLAQILSTHLGTLTAVRAAHEQEALYRLLAENSTDTIVRGNLEGVRLYISPAVRTLLGYEPEELVGRKASEIVHPDDAEEFRRLMFSIREGRIDLGVSEQRQRHKDGSWVWLEACIKLTRDEITGEPNGYVASARDISHRKEIESRLAHIASHDPLTGLPNRTLLHQRLMHEVSRAARTGIGFAVLCLDLDRFKLVNDAFGHVAGDAVLLAMAERFRSVVRAEDTVARLGGDEFVVIQTIAEDMPAAAVRLAERLISVASEPVVDFNGTPMSVGLSIGIAVAPMSGLDADALLTAADEALYDAKEAGRNRYSVFAAEATNTSDD